MNTFLKPFKLTLTILAFCMAGIQNVSASRAYAVFNSNKLTFYYDDDMGSRTGSIFTINENNLVQAWTELDQNTMIYYILKVVFDESFSSYHPTNTANWFNGLWRLKTIEGMENLNTDQCTSMYNMFYGCNELETIDLSHFNTGKVISMANMFRHCSLLKDLDLSSFSSQALEYADNMFNKCTRLESINFGSKFNVKNVTTMENMFLECEKLSYLDLTFFETSSAVNMRQMFWGCFKLATIEVSELWTMDKVEDSSRMFGSCEELTGGAGTKYDSNNADGAYAHIDGGTENPGYFTKCTEYGLWLENVRVTKLNKDYISLDKGHARYVPDENKLLLYGATIEVSEGYAIKSNLRNLTIELAGENHINATGTAAPLMPGYNIFITGDELYITTKNGLPVDRLLSFNNKFTFVNMEGSTGALFTGITKNSSALEFGSETGFMALEGGNAMTRISAVTMQGHTNFIADESVEVAFDSSQGTVLANGTVMTGGLMVGQSYPVWFDSQQGSNLTKYAYKVLFGRAPDMFDCAYDADDKLVISGKPGINNNTRFTSKAPELRIELEEDWTVSSHNEDLPAMTLEGNTTITGPGKLTVNGDGTGIQFGGTSELTDRGNLTFEDVDVEVNAGKNGILGMAFDSPARPSTLYFNNANATITSTGSGTDGYSLSGYTGLTLDKCAVINGVTLGKNATEAPQVVIDRPVKPYAVLNETGDTLTFYYDNTMRAGTVYDIPTKVVYPGWVLGKIPEGIRTVEFDESFADARPTCTYGWFMMPRLTTITGMEYLNTSEVTSMWAMFWGAQSIEELDLSHFDTSKVTDMDGMFNNCYVLKTIYVGERWTTANLSFIPEAMFNYCTHLVGGAGTTYNTGETSARWARVDGGTDRPGYLTFKSAGLKGDVNLDNKVDISDIVAVINQIAGTAHYKNANVNGDTGVDISDIVAVINIIANGPEETY